MGGPAHGSTQGEALVRGHRCVTVPWCWSSTCHTAAASWCSGSAGPWDLCLTLPACSRGIDHPTARLLQHWVRLVCVTPLPLDLR